MMGVEEEEKGFAGSRREKDYTQDGTVDLNGKPVLRSNTGSWRASSFIVGKCNQFLFLDPFSTHSFTLPYCYINFKNNFKQLFKTINSLIKVCKPINLLLFSVLNNNKSYVF